MVVHWTIVTHRLGESVFTTMFLLHLNFEIFFMEEKNKKPQYLKEGQNGCTRSRIRIAVVSLPKPAPGYSTTLFTLMHIHFIDKIKLILYPPPEFFTIDITCVLVFAASRVLHRIRKSHQCCLQHHIGLEHRHAWNKVIRKFVKSMNLTYFLIIIF